MKHLSRFEDSHGPSVIQFAWRRHLGVQLATGAMVMAASFPVLPLAATLVWGLALGSVAAVEAASGAAPEASRLSRLGALFRFLATSLYGLAALALIVRGGPAERTFAFALVACSLVYVLMRYYRSPRIFLLAISPYAAVLSWVAYGLARTAIAQGRLAAAPTAIFTLAVFSILIWSARAQLVASWEALRRAQVEAEVRAEAEAAANRAKSNFLTNMSHEVRTPLNGVLGMTRAMLAENPPEPQRERLKVIRRSAEDLLAILDDVLDLSKVEAGELELEVTDFDLEHLCRGVAAVYQPAAEKKGLAFELDVAADAAGLYRGDPLRIRRICYSLCENAVKFTDAGRVRLSASREGDELVLAVADTGIGIAADDLVRLFDDFFQVDGSLSRRHGGSGLGLAICRELATLMGGSISAASTPGEGSTFEVRLPLARAAAPDAAAESSAAVEARSLRILAAEDNETNRLVLKTLLGQIDLEVAFVEDGTAAVAAWEAEPWDVILMDIQMPGMNGVEATETIRAREVNAGRQRTPIVAVTANAMTHQVTEYQAAGMDAVVPKPVELRRLLAALQLVLGDAREEAPSQSTARVA